MALSPFFQNDASLEKRSLAKLPQYVTNEGLNLDFSDQFEAWVNDHLPLRAQLLTVSNEIRGELLRGQTANVIVGRERAVSLRTCSSVRVPWYSRNASAAGFTPGSWREPLS